MNKVKASHIILTKPENMNELQFIEQVGRTCYKSEDRITDDGESAKKFVSMLLKRGHEAMIEHWSYIFRLTDQSYKDFARLLRKLEDDTGPRLYVPTLTSEIDLLYRVTFEHGETSFELVILLDYMYLHGLCISLLWLLVLRKYYLVISYLHMN